MKALARFVLLLAVLIAVLERLLRLAFTTEAEHGAMLVSAILALIVQTAAFGIVVMAKRRNAALAGWGAGAVLRGFVLVLYGLVFARLMGLPLAAALVSFAVFLFVSMLLESFLISYGRQ